MTNEEAKKEIKKFEKCHYEKPNGDSDLRVYEALAIAVEAIDKQVPQKPITDETSYGEFITHLCPACKKRIALEPCDHSLITHCYWCGKALNWSEVE